jgi:hypothetical protein
MKSPAPSGKALFSIRWKFITSACLFVSMAKRTPWTGEWPR